jgi:purine-binding chemotaxis protein CheW
MKTRKSEQQERGCYYLVFTLAAKQFALPLEAVQRVVHAVEVTVLPKAPEIVCGLINYKGTILPIINISKRFHLAEREIHPNQHFIIVRSKIKGFGLVADTVTGVIKEAEKNVVPPTEIIAGVEFLAGVLKLKTGMMLIPDINKILTIDEERALKSAVKRGKKEKKNAQR